MTGEIKYGGVALGVEAALPAVARPAPRRGRLRRLLGMLVAALKRWA
jgi:hypothetical protein